MTLNNLCFTRKGIWSQWVSREGNNLENFAINNISFFIYLNLFPNMTKMGLWHSMSPSRTLNFTKIFFISFFYPYSFSTKGLWHPAMIPSEGVQMTVMVLFIFFVLFCFFSMALLLCWQTAMLSIMGMFLVITMFLVMCYRQKVLNLLIYMILVDFINNNLLLFIVFLRFFM